MKIIKFRAKDKTLNQYVYLTTDGGKITFRGPTVSPTQQFQSSNIKDWREFIGMCDCDGKEIYEGDSCTSTLLMQHGEPVEGIITWDDQNLRYRFSYESEDHDGKHLEGYIISHRDSPFLKVKTK